MYGKIYQKFKVLNVGQVCPCGYFSFSKCANHDSEWVINFFITNSTSAADNKMKNLENGAQLNLQFTITFLTSKKFYLNFCS